MNNYNNEDDKVKKFLERLGGGYRHIVSLGSFCSVALELERLGYRDGSYPFDWVLSRTIKCVIRLIETDFKDLFNQDYIYQWKDKSNIYENKEYDIVFAHDFSERKSFEHQLPKAIDKYKRRIQRFYKAISEKTLFIRYIETTQEYNYIKSNIWMIMRVLKKYHPENNIIFIANNDIYYDQALDDFILFVDKDENDSVARKFAEKIPELIEILNNVYYSDEKKRENIEFYRRKHKYDRIKKYKRRIIKIIKVIVRYEYQYHKQI